MNNAPVSIRILLMPLNSAMARKARRQARRASASSVLAAGCRSELEIWLMRSRDYHRNRRNATLEQKYGYFVIFQPRNDGAEGGYRRDRRRFWPIRTLLPFPPIHSGRASGRPCMRPIDHGRWTGRGLEIRACAQHRPGAWAPADTFALQNWLSIEIRSGNRARARC